jgi:hypothetical protein
MKNCIQKIWPPQNLTKSLSTRRASRARRRFVGGDIGPRSRSMSGRPAVDLISRPTLGRLACLTKAFRKKLEDF